MTSSRTAAVRRTPTAIIVIALALVLVAVVVPRGVAAAPLGSVDAVSVAVDWNAPVVLPLPRLGDAPGDATLSVFVGLVRDQVGLEALAGGLTDLSSPTFGTTVPVADLAGRFGVSAAGRQRLHDGFGSFGVPVTVDVTGAFAQAQVPVAVAETMFGTSFGLYDAGVEGSTTIEIIGPDVEPTLPASLSGVVDLVRGLNLVIEVPDPSTQFMTPARSAPVARTAATPTPGPNGGTPSRTGTPVGCAEALAVQDDGVPLGLAPNQVLDAYGIDDLHRRGLRGEGIRVALVEAGAFAPSDLARWSACFGIGPAAPVLHGTAVSNGSSLEASLDVQILHAIAPGLERLDVFYNDLSTSYPWQLAPFLSAPLDAGAMAGALPDVVSVSYGLCEPTMRDQAGAGVVAVTEFVLAAGTAAGVGYVVSSGDSGSSACLHSGTNAELAVSYPGSSAWVTTVGGTNISLSDDNEIVSQGVWHDASFFPSPPPPGAADLAGTGGTSTLVARPAWQTGPGVPSGTGRVVPDVAFFADPLPGYLVYCTVAAGPDCDPADGWQPLGGTSASTPLFAGALALLAQQARQEGQLDPGFAAPLLHQLAAETDHAAPLFWDVRIGTNDVAGVGCCDATPGFDLATGWGSIAIDQLSAAWATPSLELVADAPSSTDPWRVTLRATVDPGAGTVVGYRWDDDGDATVDAVTTEPVHTATYADPGIHRPSVEVLTARRRVGAASVTLALAPVPVPVAPGSPAAAVSATPRFTG